MGLHEGEWWGNNHYPQEKLDERGYRTKWEDMRSRRDERRDGGGPGLGIVYMLVGFHGLCREVGAGRGEKKLWKGSTRRN